MTSIPVARNRFTSLNHLDRLPSGLGLWPNHLLNHPASGPLVQLVHPLRGGPADHPHLPPAHGATSKINKERS
jgi:hypothetical protein